MYDYVFVFSHSLVRQRLIFQTSAPQAVIKQHKQWTKYGKRRHLNIHTNKWMPSGGGGAVHIIGHCFHFVLILNRVLVLCEWVQMCDEQCDGQHWAFFSLAALFCGLLQFNGQSIALMCLYLDVTSLHLGCAICLFQLVVFKCFVIRK